MVWVQIVIAVVLFVVGTLMRKGPDVNPAAFEDFGFPDVNPTKRVPIIWGKKRVKSVHSMEVQDYRTRKIKKGNFIKKHTVGFKYYATIAIGVCRGPGVAYTTIRIGDKIAFQGFVAPGDAGESVFLADSKFHGDDDGIQGSVTFYPGSPDQTPNATLAASHALLGGEAEGFPDLPYRSIAYVVFAGEGGIGGFYWGNNPRIPQIEITAERYPDTLLIGGNRKINTTSTESPSEGSVDLALPEIIHEILTDDVWGLSEPLSDIDRPSFITASTTLRAETVPNAASLIWNQGDSIRELLAIIMRQANGFVYKRMSTGKWEMNLARDDYLTGSPISSGQILEFDETNSELIKYSRGNWDETFNIIDVNWQDRNLKGKPPSAHQQDMANFSIQGVISTAEFSFPGCHSGSLAAFLASRQLRAVSWPLAIVELTTMRLAFDVVPGDMVTFNWDKLGISNLFMRVNSINLGTLEQGEIRISLVQDVFSAAQTVFTRPLTSLSTPQNPDPLQIVDAVVIDQTPFLSSLDDENPSLREKPLILAKAPQGNALEYQPSVKLAVKSEFTEQDVRWAYAPNGTLDKDYDRSTDDGNTIASVLVEGLDDPDVDLSQAATKQKELGEGMILIEDSGSPTSGEFEICTYDSASISGVGVTLTNVHRGMEDTVPRQWKQGDRVWFMFGAIGTTLVTYEDNDDIDVRLKNIATTGSTDISGAINFDLLFRRRLDRPIVPGGLEIGSSGESPQFVRYPQHILAPGDLRFRWNRRDLTQNRQAMFYQEDADDPSQSPASHQIQLDIYESQGGTVTFLRTYVVNGNNQTYNKADQTTDGVFNRYMVVLRSFDLNESPGLESVTLVRQKFRRNPLISPLASPTGFIPASPQSPRYGSPVASPLSPIHSPLSPVPSPTSPFPRISPIVSPHTSPSSPVASPLSPRSPNPSPLSPHPSPFSPHSPSFVAPLAKYSGFIEDEGPVLYWPLTDPPGVSGSPDQIEDESPISSGSVIEVIKGLNTFTDGSVSKGAYPITRDQEYSASSLGEDNSKIIADDDPALDFADTYSWSFWFLAGKQLDNANDRGTLISRSSGPAQYAAQLNDDNHATAALQGLLRIGINKQSASPQNLFIHSTRRLDDMIPHHIVVTCTLTGSPGTGTLLLYVDGMLDGRIENAFKPDASANPFQMLGRAVNSCARAQLAHVAIWNRELSSDDVLTHYMEGTRWSPFYSQALKMGLDNWWRLWDSNPRQTGSPVDLVRDTPVKDWSGASDGIAIFGPESVVDGPLLGGQQSLALQMAHGGGQESPSTGAVGLPTNFSSGFGSPEPGSGMFACFFRHNGDGSPATIANRAILVAADGTAVWAVRVNSSDQIFVTMVRDGSNNVSFTLLASLWPGDAVWAHFAMVADGTNALRIFINGVRVDDADITIVTNGTGASSWWIADVDLNNPTTAWTLGLSRFNPATSPFVTDSPFSGDMAEVMFIHNRAPSDKEVMDLYAASQAHYPTLHDNVIAMNPYNALQVDSASVAQADDMGNLADGVNTGTLTDGNTPLAADEPVGSVYFDRSAASSYITWDADSLLNEFTDVQSPEGNLPKLSTIFSTIMHQQFKNTFAVTSGLSLALTMVNPAGTNLNYMIKIRGNMLSMDQFPENGKELFTAAESFRPSQARALTYIHNADGKPRGQIISPRDGTYRRLFLDDKEAEYYKAASPGLSPNPDVTGIRSYIEKYKDVAITKMRIGQRHTASGANNFNHGGTFGHLAAWNRSLFDVEARRLGLRRRGFQEFELELMQYGPEIYWKLNEPVGYIDQILDWSENGNDGDRIGTVVHEVAGQDSNLWDQDNGVTDLDGGAVKFNGGSPGFAGSDTPFTMGGWVRVPDDESPLNTVIAQIVLYNTATGASHAQLTIQSGVSPIQFNVRFNFGGSAEIIGTTTITPGSWVFITASWDPAATSILVTLNGGLEFEDGTPGSPASQVYDSFGLNTREASPAVFDSMYHDCFLISDMALDLDQIQRIHARSFAPTYDSFVKLLGATGYWKLEEDSAVLGPGVFMNSIADAAGHFVSTSLAVGSPEPVSGALPIIADYPMPSVEFAGGGALDTGWLDYVTGSDPWSVSFWMFKELNASYTGTTRIMSWGENVGAGSPHNRRLEIQIKPTGAISVNFEAAGDRLEWSVSAQNQNIHVALVFSGPGASDTQLFINGLDQGAPDIQGSSPGQSPNIVNIQAVEALHIGSDSLGSSALEAGRLGRIAYFPSVLTQDHVRALYAAGTGASADPGLCNIVTGGIGTVGFSVTPILGSSDNVDPIPPDASPLEMIRLVQKGDFTWDLRFDSTVGEFAWTSLTLTGLNTVVLLSADNDGYTANSFGQTLWSFPASADCWTGLGPDANVTATFA